MCLFPCKQSDIGQVTSAKQRFTDETHFDIEQSDIRYMKKTDETQSDIEQSDIRETAWGKSTVERGFGRKVAPGGAIIHNPRLLVHVLPASSHADFVL